MGVSKKIIQRIRESGKRYYASDNISEFISDKEREKLIDELTLKFESVLESLVIDIENDPNSKDTGRRLAKMYINEIMYGRYFPVPVVTAFPNDSEDTRYDGMLVVRADIKSICSHHHQPVVGVCFIGILPDHKVLGLSKYIRLAQWAARRGTLQEELCSYIRKLISEKTDTDNVAVYIQATHGCVSCRGVQQPNSLTQTASLGGMFSTDPDVKKEFYDNIKMSLTTPFAG